MLGLTIGTFDFMHEGHAALIGRAMKLVDRLIVGVNTDEFVESYKGVKPHYTLEQRMSAIEDAFPTVGVCISYGTGWSLIETITPDVFIIGSDWRSKNLYKQLSGGSRSFDMPPVIYLPYTEGISSTQLRDAHTHRNA